MAPYAGLWLNLDADGYVTQGTIVLYDDDGSTHKQVKSKMPPSDIGAAFSRLGVRLEADGRLTVYDERPLHDPSPGSPQPPCHPGQQTLKDA